jgi:hypothetical protein
MRLRFYDPADRENKFENGYRVAIARL